MPQVEAITAAARQDIELSMLLANGSLRVETADGAQGGEADYVILSMVRYQPPHGLGFLNQPNRLCVAISRAKELLLVVGHAETISASRNVLLQNLLQVLCGSVQLERHSTWDLKAGMSFGQACHIIS
jgi:superfamily I DNA and/or RNA helicase